MDRSQTSAPADRIRVHALIPAAGRGARFGNTENKLFAMLAGRPIIAHTVARFTSINHEGSPLIDSITVIGQSDELNRLADACTQQDGSVDPRVHFCQGGQTRQESVHLGLESLNAAQHDIVLVHDGARPLTDPESIRNCVLAVRANGAAIVGMPIVETIKRATDHTSGVGFAIAETLDRSSLWTAQTPQGATFKLLREAQVHAKSIGFVGTDEASLLEQLPGGQPRLVLGTRENVKITTPDDIAFAEFWLKAPKMTASQNQPPIRVGTGYDIHRLVPERPLVLGGVKIESDQGLLGHSDADVLLHAICDALLGAAGQSDIGHLFPNDDPAYAGADSIKLLGIVARRITECGYSVGNVDCCVIAERPKIGPHIAAMRARIATALEIDECAVGIKATTNEGIGALGAGEGIACHATATIFTKPG